MPRCCLPPDPPELSSKAPPRFPYLSGTTPDSIQYNPSRNFCQVPFLALSADFVKGLLAFWRVNRSRMGHRGRDSRCCRNCCSGRLMFKTYFRIMLKVKREQQPVLSSCLVPVKNTANSINRQTYTSHNNTHYFTNCHVFLLYPMEK
jgi:hypothetical protein